jgi:hypothetical protein
MMVVLTLFGSVDQAFHWLNVALDQGSLDVIWIGFRPNLDYLHEGPRFIQLIKRIGPRVDIAASSWPIETSNQTEE